MADDSTFKVRLLAQDAASPELKRVAETASRIGKVMHAAGEHFRGVASVWHAATGSVERDGAEAEHAMHKVAKAAGEMGRAFHGAGKEAKEAAHETEAFGHLRSYETLAAHATLLRTHFGNIRMGFGELGHSVTEFLPLLGGLAIGGGLGELAEQVSQVSEKFSDLARQASIAGTSVGQIQSLQLGAKLHDISPDVVPRALFRFGFTLQQASQGMNRNAASLLRHLHLNTKLPNQDLLLQFADAIKATKSEKMRQLMAETMLGRGGGELLPLLELGSKGLKDIGALSARYDFLPSKEQQEQLEKFHASMTLAANAVQGFRDAVGTALAPVLQPVVQQVTDWVADNKEFLANSITKEVRSFADVMKNVDWKAIGAVLRTLGEDAKGVADRMGGFQHIVETLIAIKVVGWAAGFSHKMVTLASDIAKVTGAVTALGTAIDGSLLGRLVTKIPVLGSSLAAGVGAGLYTLLHPTQTDTGERAQLDAWLKAHHITPPPHPDVRALSNAVAAANAALPDERHPEHSRPGFPAPIHYGDTLLRPLPRLYGPGGVLSSAHAPAAAPTQGDVRVHVEFANTPEKTRISTDARGNVQTDLDVGYAMSDLGLGW